MTYASEADRDRLSNEIRAVGMDLDSIAYFEPRLSAAICAAIGELRGIAGMIASGHAFGGLPPEPTWQPIATAPKDGTHLLLYRCDLVQEAWWRSDIFDQNCWGGNGWSYPEHMQPTYWMPKPNPPKEAV